MKQTLHAFDKIIGGIISRMPKSIRPLMQLFTLVGQPPFTVGIGALAIGYGQALNKSQYTAAGIAIIATLAVASLMKLFLRRRRPSNSYVRNMLFHTFSFPSGHAVGAVVSYGYAGLIFGMRWPEWAPAIWLAAVVLILGISISRVYLGAHYASDIIGGWVVGTVGLVFILSLYL